MKEEVVKIVAELEEIEKRCILNQGRYSNNDTKRVRELMSRLKNLDHKLSH